MFQNVEMIACAPQLLRSSFQGDQLRRKLGVAGKRVNLEMQAVSTKPHPCFR